MASVSAKTLPVPPNPEAFSDAHSNLFKHKTLNLTRHRSRLLVFPNQTHNNSTSSVLNSASSTPSTSTNFNYQLNQFCLQGDLQKALEYLDVMHDFGIPVDQDIYIALLTICERRRAFWKGSRIYSYISKSTIDLDIPLGNALLSMFVRFDNLDDAWYVFGKMRHRNVFSWNILVGGYAKAGFFDEAINLYHRMLWVAGVRPDVYTFPCVLRTCGALPDLARGREIHVHIIRYGYESEVDVLNALITMYVKCGDLTSARLVFDRMHMRDRISWNAMISGYVENGQCEEGRRLFLQMSELGIVPDPLTMTSVLSACQNLVDERLGRELHGYAIISGLRLECSVSSSLIMMYCNARRCMEAEKVFAQMESRDVVSWTAMISGYQENEFFSKALETYKLMVAEGITPDEIAIGAAISACASLSLLDLGIKFHELACSTGHISNVKLVNNLVNLYSKCKRIDKALEVFYSIPDKDVISWTSIISGLQFNGRFLKALFFFNKMKLSVDPNSVTLLSVVSVCGRIGALMSGKEIHAYALRTEVAFDGFMPNALLDMYVRCGRMTSAWRQFNRQKEDLTSWNIILTGYAQKGEGRGAIQLFKRLVSSNMKPDAVTFTSLLCACSRSGLVDEGLNYFETMQHTYLIDPTLVHYACVVDLLGRSGKLEDAYNFIQEMPINPDPPVWGALLNACRIYRNIELGELAASKIFEVDDQSVGYYILLCNLYAESGKWDQFLRVRRIMQERGLILDPACSWIDVKGKLHAFLNNDGFHPQIREINGVLKGFYRRMVASGLHEDEFIAEEASKSEVFCGHSERLAITFGLINTAPGTPVLVSKNLNMCRNCHNTVKFISKVVRREISVRDSDCFHLFKHGLCSCGDRGYWEKLERHARKDAV